MDTKSVKYLISRIREYNNLINALNSQYDYLFRSRSSRRAKVYNRIKELSNKRKFLLEQLRHKGEGTISVVTYLSSPLNPGPDGNLIRKEATFINLSRQEIKDLLDFWGSISQVKVEILEIKETEIKV